MATYPQNWPEMARACKERAGWRCEWCGSRERLGAAHLDHDPENPTPRLACLCWPCHRRYDARTGGSHPGKQARRRATRERTRATREDPHRAAQEQAAREARMLATRARIYARYGTPPHEEPVTRVPVPTPPPTPPPTTLDVRVIRYMEGSPRK